MSTNHVSIRLDEATMARIDALGDVFSTEWHVATRSDILRALILLSLVRYERELGLVPADAEAQEARGERVAPGARTASPPGEPPTASHPSRRRRRKRASPSRKRGG